MLAPLGTPRYVCHKEVSALKITAIKPAVPDSRHGITTLRVEPAAVGFVIASRDFMERHKPQVGGYLVYYQDGYQSYSPAEAFEEGYKPL